MIKGLEDWALEWANLQFSLLETMGNLLSNTEGLQAEKLWKKKFGPKATELNGN